MIKNKAILKVVNETLKEIDNLVEKPFSSDNDEMCLIYTGFLGFMARFGMIKKSTFYSYSDKLVKYHKLKGDENNA